MERALNAYFPNPAFNRNSLIKYSPPQFPPKSEWHKLSPHIKGLKGLPKPAPPPGFPGYDASADRKPQMAENDVNFYVLPVKVPDGHFQNTYESYLVMLQRLRNQVRPLPLSLTIQGVFYK